MSRIEFLFEYLKSGKILDIGNISGQGEIHQKIINKFPDAEIYGLDVTDQKESGLNFNNQTIGSAENMPYQENFFDFIYIGEVLEHSWRPKKILEECFRVLKTGGLLVADVPNIYALSRVIRYFFKGRDVILGDPDHKIFFSRAMLENMIEKSGYVIIKIATDRRCTVKCRNLILPNFGSFVFMGEHLMIAAQKPN
ncbi:MAG: methyltransferase domain-containing protein [Patescibacteria group bacterium]|nr:methyltransferase domain-containing protein [Patescibacteria group bacterium]